MLPPTFTCNGKNNYKKKFDKSLAISQKKNQTNTNKERTLGN